MPLPDLADLAHATKGIPVRYDVARLSEVHPNFAVVEDAPEGIRLGDRVTFPRTNGMLEGEIVSRSGAQARLLFEGAAERADIGDPVVSLGPLRIAPCDSWLGRVIDSRGSPLDGQPLLRGASPRVLAGEAPGHARRHLGERLRTGLAVFDTALPIVRGQRLGVFAGAGVGKSTLIGTFASHLEADVVVIALVGERGREVGGFLDTILGPRGLSRSVVVVETSDRPSLARRRVVSTAIAVAEHFRDQGLHVLFVVDSITRLAEAHREIALTNGEPPALRGHPPSLVPLLAGLVERTGTGAGAQGDITAVFSILVPGSDMDEPVADTMLGLLDGHAILTRSIAEKGRFPAVDLLQSVSRALPDCASGEENGLLAELREDIALVEGSDVMLRTGLYQPGGDPRLDLAIARRASVAAFLSSRSGVSDGTAFDRLRNILSVDVDPVQSQKSPDGPNDALGPD